MEQKDIFQLYEKHYFHELESREKLNSRLQTPLTLIVSFVGVLAFMLQNYKVQGWTIEMMVFVAAMTIASILLFVALWFFVKAWYRNLYVLIPSAIELEKYRKALVQYYQSQPNATGSDSNEFMQYVQLCYVMASSKNAMRNQKRGDNLRLTNGTLIATSVIIFFAFAAFYKGNLDKSNTVEQIKNQRVFFQQF